MAQQMRETGPTGPLAEADRAYGEMNVPADKRKDRGHEGVHPYAVHPDQPVFPRPHGVEPRDLHRMGVAPGYAGVPSEEELDKAEQAPGRPRMEPEGKPRHPRGAEIAEQTTQLMRERRERQGQPHQSTPERAGDNRSSGDSGGRSGGAQASSDNEQRAAAESKTSAGQAGGHQGEGGKSPR